MLHTTINGHPFSMLYDTGSCTTCMSLDTLHTLQKQQTPLKILNTPKKKFNSADGGEMFSQGRYEIEIEVEGKTLTYPFYVLPKLHEDFIVGIDFIKTFELHLCFKHNHFHYEPSCPIENSRNILSCKETYLPPNGSALIQVNIETQPQDEPNLCMVAEINIKERPWIKGAPSLIQLDKNGKSFIEIHNASLTPRLVKSNEILGIAEPIDHTKLEPLNYTNQTSKNKTCHNKLTKEDIQFIQDKADIQGPPEELKNYLEIFHKFPDIFSRHKNDLGNCHLLKHKIHLKTKEPVYIKQFKIPEGHQDTVKQQVTEWLKLGIIQASRSRYNSPIFVVKKKDGSFRLVQDFRALNQNTYIDKYSMRDVSDCIHEIGKAESTIFSTIDLTSGFWQMVLEPESRPLTAFTVYGMGQYEFTTSPMGLLGCPASFQRLMEAVTKDLPNVIVYIDDILVHSKTHAQHQHILRLLFERLSQHNLKIRLEKCHFAKTEVEYLGFRLTPKGILPGTDKVQAVRDTKPPTTVHQVRQFLGLCNFFRQHIKQFALRSHPLTTLTRKDCNWKGGTLPPDALKSFNELKSCLTSKPIVSFPKRHLQYALITDAATGDENHPGGMGAILTQIDKDGKFYVIAYASKKIEKHEKNYTPFLLEMYAAVWGMEHFSHHLRGKRFLLFTDHKPLEKLGKVHTKTLYRIQEAMLNYDFEIHYRKGDDMPADYLSRNVLAITDDIDNICQQQIADPQLSLIINYLKTGDLPINKEGRTLITKYATRCYLEDDILWIRFFDPIVGHRSLICVPKSMVNRLCSQYHKSWYGGHEGLIKMKQRLLQRYFWPHMEKDLQQEIDNCHQCQVRKKDEKHRAPLHPLPITSQPNQRIHADLFGPLKTSEKGKKFILVITDAFTKYIELVATENKEADTIANNIFNTWICRFGIPAELVTDQGKEFTAQVCSRLWHKLEIIHSTTTARHPQTNSQAEVVNKTIARYLAAFVNESTLDWEPYLPALMFSYNTSFHRSIKTSPFFLTYGIEPVLPKQFDIDYKIDTATDIMTKLQLARHLAKQHIETQIDNAKIYYDKDIKPVTFYKHQPVLLDEHYYINRNQKIAPKFTGPHLVIQMKGETNVELLLNNGKTTIVHVNRVKPYNSRENLPQDFSKPEKGVGMPQVDDPECKQRHKTLHTKFDTPIEDEEVTVTPQIPVAEQAPRSDKVLTRSQARQQGLVYNKDTETFQHPSLQEAIEALRRKSKKKLLHRKIQDRNEYILVEDVYYQVPTQRIPFPRSSTPIQDESAPWFTPKREPVTEEEETEPPKKVLFDPIVQDKIFHVPLKPTTPHQPTFAQELLDSTSDLLLPKIPKSSTLEDRPISDYLLPRVPKQSISEDRPIKGNVKTYAQLLDDMSPRHWKPPSTESRPPSGLANPFPEIPEDVKPFPIVTETTNPTAEVTEGASGPLEQQTTEPDPTPRTRSHHPPLNPGLP